MLDNNNVNIYAKFYTIESKNLGKKFYFVDSRLKKFVVFYFFSIKKFLQHFKKEMHSLNFHKKVY